MHGIGPKLAIGAANDAGWPTVDDRLRFQARGAGRLGTDCDCGCGADSGRACRAARGRGSRPYGAQTRERPPGRPGFHGYAGRTGKSKPDLYAELIKLDELRKRRILTDEEFQALKATLIAGR